MNTPGRRAAGPRVLFLSALQIHPTRSGGNLRSFALAGALQRQGCDVFVHSLVGRKQDYLRHRPSAVQPWPEGVEEYVDRGLAGFLAQYGSYALGLPPLWLTAYLKLAAASPRAVLAPARLREKLAWCDVVVADFPFVHPVFSFASARGKVRVLSTHNVEHELQAQGGRSGGLLRGLVRRIELRAVAASDILVTCCEADRRFFESNAPVRRSVVVPNAIDVRRFRGLETARAGTRQALGLGEDVLVLLFTASKYPPNYEAFAYLTAFATTHHAFLAEQKIHILVVGNVSSSAVRRPGLTATGPVDAVEPYFAAADAALNPLTQGAGTNVKMYEFIAARLPLVTTVFGARGFALEQERTAILFERPGLREALSHVRRIFDEQPSRLRRMADAAYRENEAGIDMDACARPLVQAIRDAAGRRTPPAVAPPPVLSPVAERTGRRA